MLLGDDNAMNVRNMLVIMFCVVWMCLDSSPPFRLAEIRLSIPHFAVPVQSRSPMAFYNVVRLPSLQFLTVPFSYSLAPVLSQQAKFLGEAPRDFASFTQKFMTHRC